MEPRKPDNPKTRVTNTTPHDRFVRSVFKDLNLVRAFLREWLPSDFLKHVDLSHLKALSQSFISPALGGTEAVVDLLYETKLSQHTTPAQILIEHKSYPDRFTPLQTHLYQAYAWGLYHRQYPTQPLPLIFKLVLYHGREAYSPAHDIGALIDAPLELTNRYVLHPSFVVDFHHTPDTLMKGPPELQAIELALKHVFDEDALPSFKQRIVPLIPSMIHYGHDLAKILLDYLFITADISDRDEFIQLVNQASTKIGGNTMTLAEQFREEGHQKGRQEGLLEAQRDFAKRLIVDGVNDAFVLKHTGITTEELRNAKSEINKEMGA